MFSAVREIIAAFAGDDPHLGLYGAFGYDLAFQFEPVRLRADRPADQRDLVLHLPDELYVVDRKREFAAVYRYEFEVGGISTAGLSRTTPRAPAGGQRAAAGVKQDGAAGRPEPGSYARIVQQAKQRFARGDLFEVVPSHVFHGRCDSPAAFYDQLRRTNPAPYEFFFNLGEEECLVGASPEMYVRVSGDRVETCPISGTIRRGADPLADAENIRALLNSAKDESELTMCTDVDRNDKSRVCVPGSVRVIGRRQIEMYSRLIHTVDHIEGRLRPGLDALDAFLTHMWAVTVTGAPKTWAMQFIEDHEGGPRRWYGGAVGVIGFDGSMNTGLTLRTAHITGGVAAVRAGATLLFESDPMAEERETELKARALLETLAGTQPPGPRRRPGQSTAETRAGPGAGLRVLLVDHQDSFVHTLAGYFREHGAEVLTLRAGLPAAAIDDYAPDLVVLSPGPAGRPTSAVPRCSAWWPSAGCRCSVYASACRPWSSRPAGSWACWPSPRTASRGRCAAGRGPARIAGCWPGCPRSSPRPVTTRCTPSRSRSKGGYQVTAVTPDGVVMAIEDDRAGRWAVQFHPESILTASGRAGHQVIGNVLRLGRARMAAPASADVRAPR